MLAEMPNLKLDFVSDYHNHSGNITCDFAVNELKAPGDQGPIPMSEAMTRQLHSTTCVSDYFLSDKTTTKYQAVDHLHPSVN